MEVPEQFTSVRAKTSKRLIAACEILAWTWSHSDESGSYDHPNPAHDYHQHINHGTGNIDHDTPTPAGYADYLGPSRLRDAAHVAQTEGDVPEEMTTLIIDTGDSALRDTTKMLTYFYTD